MSNSKTDYLIIGNSAAGVTAAETIRKVDNAGTITILGDEPYPVYGRPLISYMIEGKTGEDNVWFKSPNFYDDLNIQALLGPEFEAVKLEPKSHEVTLKSSSVISYKKCLLATGSYPFVPDTKGLDDVKEVYRFITLDDAKAAWKATIAATKQAHEEGRKSLVIVIGGGLIGLKAAEALSYHADEILAFERNPRILPAVLDSEGAAILQKMLATHNITCMPGNTVDSFIVKDGKTTAVLTNGDEVHPDVVITAVGVRPNSKLAVDAGAKQGRGLICDARLQTSLPDVYAAGDVVQVSDVLSGAERPLALWPNAMEQGKVAGLHMAGSPAAEPFDGSFAVNAVDFFDYSLLTSGIINPADDSGCEEQIIIEGETYKKFVTREGVLVGYILLNEPHGAGIYTALIRNKTPLAEIDPSIFKRIPQNLDFKADYRWERLHRHYPKNLDTLGFSKEVCA